MVRKIFCFILVMSFLLLAIVFEAQASGEVVYVISLAGEVKVIPSGWEKAVSCKPGMRIKEGTRITTGKESYVELAFNKARSNIVKVMEDSNVILKLDGYDKIELVNGEIVTLLKGMKKGEKFRVKTPSAVCAARGTGWNTKTDGKTTDVSVFLDTVGVRGLNKDGSVMENEYSVKEGFERRIKRSENPGNASRISETRLNAMRGAMKLKSIVSQQVKKPGKKESPGSVGDPAKLGKLNDVNALDNLKIEKLDRLRNRRNRIDKRLDRKDRLNEGREGTIIDRRERFRINRLPKDREQGIIRIRENNIMVNSNRFSKM